MSTVCNHTLTPEALRAAIRGCWLGKNIGGTLGAPFEGKTDLLDLSFYTQKDLGGNPEPNDDLDLQLLWLTLVEYYGIQHLTPRLMGQYWINGITGPWNEYGICRWNCQNGLFPPLSGATDNDVWKWSNGAWIRSEIWACLFPGAPDRAVEYAWRDACCDHEGEGIYAEMFTAALESAAFVEKDMRRLIAVGLSKIPPACRVAQSVKTVCQIFDEGGSWQTARNKTVEENSDLGWFQAPGNLAFVVIGLLYGGGDFGRTVCIAANCGDDTDCTAATAGAIMGIVLGDSGIPEEWSAPIGERILTKSLDPFGIPLPLPKTITELTDRVLFQYERIARYFPEEQLEDLCSDTVAEKIWGRSSYELQFDTGFGIIGVEYLEGACIEGGKRIPLKLWLRAPIMSKPEVRFRWLLPENWSSDAAEVRVSGCIFCETSVMTELTPPEVIPEAMSYIPLEVTVDDRSYPVLLNIPFRRKGAVSFPRFRQEFSAAYRRQLIAGYTQYSQS